MLQPPACSDDLFDSVTVRDPHPAHRRLRDLVPRRPSCRTSSAFRRSAGSIAAEPELAMSGILRTCTSVPVALHR